jgi:hypothetical protein|tara:strand:+ start:126 stop:644 length:519 start_codon:yes stop_codon:yes gene_type:complete
MAIRVPVKGQIVRKTYDDPKDPDGPIVVDLLPLELGPRNALKAMGYMPMPAAIKLEVDEDKVAAHAKEKGISEDEARDYMQTVVDGLQAQAMLLFRSRGTSTTDPEVLAGARAAFVGGVRLIEGVTFEGGPDTISDSEAAGFLWDYADDWLRDAICSDLVDLNSPGADDLGN